MSERVPRSGRSRPAGPGRASPTLAPRELCPWLPGPQNCALSRWGAQGLSRCWQRRGPSALSSRPGRPAAHPKDSSCPAFRPLPLWSPQSPVITLFLTFRPQSKQFTWAPVTPHTCPCAHGDGHPARHNQHQALTSGSPDLSVPLQEPLLKPQASPSSNIPVRPWISPGVALTVPPAEALRPPQTPRPPPQTLPPVSQHRQYRIRPKKVFCFAN